MEKQKLEGKLITCMHDFVKEMEEKANRIRNLTTELRFGNFVAITGGRSCELLEYYLDKTSSNPNSYICFTNTELKLVAPLILLPSLEQVLEDSEPFSKFFDSDSCLYDANSKDLVVNPELQWTAFQIYEETYKHWNKKEYTVLERECKVIEIIQVDKYFRPSFEK